MAQITDTQKVGHSPTVVTFFVFYLSLKLKNLFKSRVDLRSNPRKL